MVRRVPLLVTLLALASCGDEPLRPTSGTGAKARHPNEIAASDELPTMTARPEEPGAVPENGDTAVLTLLSDIDGFNPFTSSSAEASEVQELIFPRLMIEEADCAR